MAKEKSWYKYLPDENLDVCEENLEEFFRTMYERQEIWYKRNMLKLPPPWTKDPILRDSKFTNVYRELDRSSQYLIHNIIRDEKITDLHELLWKMIVYRFYNHNIPFEAKEYKIVIPTYKDFKSSVLWESTVTYRENVGNPWHSAYSMNPTNVTKRKMGWIEGKKRGIFRDYVYNHVVFKAVHKIIPQLVKVFKNGKPIDIINLLLTLPAVAMFMSTEFFIDMTYIPLYRDDIKFRWTSNDWFNAGPGAVTGLRLIFPSLPEKDKETGIEWLYGLAEEWLAKFGEFKSVKWDKKKKEYVLCSFNLGYHAEEMWLCEAAKIFKMKIGEGKQRSKFVPYEEK